MCHNMNLKQKFKLFENLIQLTNRQKIVEKAFSSVILFIIS